MSERARRGAASLLRYSPAAMLVAIAVADATRFADPDLWGHLRFGQATLAHGHLTLSDPYSYSAFGLPWHNHEWLTEVLMAALYNLFGVVGLKLWKFAMTAVTLIFVAVAMAETSASITLQLLLMLAAALALSPQLQFRPQLFTFAFLSILIAMLTRYNYRGRALLWLAIPMLALWANLHGGFIVGIATLGLFTIVIAAQDLLVHRGLRRAIYPGAITIAAIVATLLNPYGIGMWYAVGHALANPFTRGAVSDWRPMGRALVVQAHLAPLGIIYYGAVIALLGGFVLSIVMAPRGGDLPLIAVAIMMTAAALLSVRNMALAVIAAAAPLARHAELAMAAGRTADAADTAAPPPLRQAPVNQLIMAAAAIALAGYTGLFSGPLLDAGRYPVGAVAFMETHHLHGNLLCDFNWGEYLIWHLWPGSKVFIDGRYDTVYPEKVFDDYLTFYLNRPGAAEVLKRYPHDFVLIPIKCKAYLPMSANPGWKLIYHDADAALFAPAGSPAAGIPEVPISGTAPPNLFP
ncbi:MAG TPA: hypothetical protein VMD75_00235 [Candidatus Binataceae bacterium]|nr:hypothetical protein [Candidatus Binataceae bacterium]